MRSQWRHRRHSLRLLCALIDARLRGRPVLLSHLVTCRCPCRCETCLWRDLVTEEMTAAEITRVYQDAASIGILINSIWGGEPLVRQDLAAILQASHEAGLVTTLITNGLWFNERFDELIPWLDVIIFSLDYPSPKHDQMRGVPGLFQAVNEAIDRCRRSSEHTRVIVNSVISRLNEDAIMELAEWARDKDTPIYFHPIEVGLSGNPDSTMNKQSLAVEGKTLADLFRRLIVLKARNYPIRNSYNYLRTFINGKQPYRCHARKICIELRPNGDLVDCLDRFHPVANLREIPLSELLARPEINRLRFQNPHCHKCNNANVIDTSYIWELRPESILSLIHPYLQGEKRNYM